MERLRRNDYLLVGVVSLVLFGYALVETRPLTMHEAVLPQNAREMFADHDWLIPKYGGQPWLERPPLPQWLTVGIASVVGRCDSEWIVRLGPVLTGVAIVLIAGWMASVWLGRGMGVFTALILATMWEFYTYASDAESDIYLCLIVTAALAVFVKLEFLRRPTDAESTSFWGGRPWLVLAFFILFGMTNLAKGLIFGTLMVAVPVAGYLVWNLDWQTMRRYVWLWGWLAFAVVALTWPVSIYCIYPDVLELWASDYVGRLNQGFVREPVYYYATAIPWVIFPWTIPALIGLFMTAKKAFGERYSLERFLWCWAILTPVVFSIPQGKHHHYLLQLMIPWAVLSALGSVRLWQAFVESPAWFRNPAFALLTLALPADLAIAHFGAKIPGPGWLVPCLMVLCPIFVYCLNWSLTRTDGRQALTSFFTLLTVTYCASYSYKTHEYDRYYHDTAFVKRVRIIVPAEESILVHYDPHVLEAFRTLFYLDDNAKLLHNWTYLRSDRIRESEIYVIGRGHEEAELAKYGTPKVVLQSKQTRGESSPQDRWTLFRLRFHDHLTRVPANLDIRPMQASGRAAGPYLQ